MLVLMNVFLSMTTIQYQGLSVPLKPKNNPKINLKQNTNPPISNPKPKNTSNSPNQPHTPKITSKPKNNALF